ncbi:hypothetical protein SAMN05421788_105298 [Filimonas lacunae]|uniref:WD40-like Beta Propeller Repeat n=1 Tax=Filimonas lacunae TaxID=477680 RepID=A0A173MCG9_9BACT|nr:hypothetical protein [Filimonas lacunae]BAV05245.1 hypothetical protein FLA_1252 [Filimonas lacunae]SIT22414.1 hypothetical protein SAMN05421788_105298 [Filimonas lacunae]
MNIFNRLLVVIVLVLFLNEDVRAQVFGGNAASLRWKQINTDTVRIVFPEGLDSVAQRVAALTHHMQLTNSATLGGLKRKVSIVLQSGTTYSNGYVGLSPYRSEFFLMPPQSALELGAQSWADNLAIHEYRHIEQYSNFRHGLSRLMSFLFGQDGQDLANSAAVPNWFFEGDAVYNETLLSKQGRGRLPYFFNGYKSLFYEGRDYSYMKLRNGSYRDFVPDHYRLGYLLVAYGREKYGDSLWLRVTQDAVRFKPLLYPFQGALKKHTGVSYRQFVQQAMEYYQQQWKVEPDSSVKWVTNTEPRNVVNYQFPYLAGDGSVIALKNSNTHIPGFYRLQPDGREEKIAVRDIAYDDYFSYNNDRIAYAGYEADLRWGNKEYSDIHVLDVKNGETRRLTHKGRYFSPDISHDGGQVVATAYSEMQQSSLVWLDADGKVLRSVEGENGKVYSFPKFSGDDRFVYWIERDKAGRMAIQRQAVAGGDITPVLPYANRILSYPVVQGDTLLYTCSNDGKDEIWAYVESAGKHYRVASHRTGLYQAAMGANGQVVSSVFTSSGFRLGAVAAQWQPVAAADTLEELYVNRVNNSLFNNTLSGVTSSKYPVTRYHKSFRLLNLHSWQPDYDDPDFKFTIYGENVLNTLQSQLYYQYNRTEGFHKAGYTGVYGGWYVQPFIGASHTWNRNTYYNRDTSFYWQESNVNAGLQLPLNLSGGKQYRYVTLSSSFNLLDRQWTGIGEKLLIPWPTATYLESRIRYSSQIQTAARQIYPHWAHSLLLQYRNVLNPSLKGQQWLANGYLYLPGIGASHSIVLNGAYQGRDTMVTNYTNGIVFESNFPFSRGYQGVSYPRMWKLGVNYHLPLCLPDWGLAQVVYFKRVRANLFYDITGGRSLRYGTTTHFASTGAEIYFDTKWWNQEDVTFGFRYSHLLNAEYTGVKNSGRWEIIWPVNLFGR